MKFRDQLGSKIQAFEMVLFSHLPEEEGKQIKLFEAMNYSVQAGGKRLRPLFLQEIYRLLQNKEGEPYDEHYFKSVVNPFAVALELIHTYSLVHDDLPAMDNDRYRRGKLTTHAAFGEDMGILAGDALLNYAYEMVAKSFENIESFSPEQFGKLYLRVSRAFRILSEKSGAYGMVGGQTVDVLETGKPIDEEVLLFIYQRKTAALLQAAFTIGAVLAGAKEEILLKVEEIALYIGLAFQIQDDILDVVSTKEVLGKSVHSDIKNEKTTYVTIFGMEEAVVAVKRYSEQALDLFDCLSMKQGFLRELIVSLITRSA